MATAIPIGFEYKDKSPLVMLGRWTSFAVEEKEATLKLATLEIPDISLKPKVNKKAKFLSFAGIWKDVDTERIKKEIAWFRKKSARASFSKTQRKYYYIFFEFRG